MKCLVGYLLVNSYVMYNKSIVNGWIINVLVSIMIVNKLKHNNNVCYIDPIYVYSIIINVSQFSTLKSMIVINLIKYLKIFVDNTNQFVHILLQILSVLK